MSKKKHKVIRRVFGLTFGVLLLLVLVVVGTNAAVIGVGGSKFVDSEQAKQQNAQCILVLGASVLPDGSPSGILQDRLDVAIQLYQAGVAPKLIMSGDNGEASYNEVLVMKNYAISQGVPSADVFCDHAGFSTYESMYRAKSIFEVKNMVVVTQSYHLYRALYVAQGLGLDVAGVPSDVNTYAGQPWFDLREVPARTKDFFQTLFKLPFAFEGEHISLNQSGDVTEDSGSPAYNSRKNV